MWARVVTPTRRYSNYKNVTKVVTLPDRPSVVALIDVDKVCNDTRTSGGSWSPQGNLMDILQQKFLKSIPFWDGTCSSVAALPPLT